MRSHIYRVNLRAVVFVTTTDEPEVPIERPNAYLLLGAGVAPQEAGHRGPMDCRQCRQRVLLHGPLQRPAVVTTACVVH